MHPVNQLPTSHLTPHLTPSCAQRYLEALQGKVGRLKPKFAANVVWACATLRIPCDSFCCELTDCMANRVQEYPPKQLANLVWGWARLNHRPPPELLDAMLEQIQRRSRNVAPQDWDSLLWGLNRMQEPVPPMLLDQCADTLVQLKRHVKGRTLCSVIKSFCASLDKPTYSVEQLVSVRVVLCVLRMLLHVEHHRWPSFVPTPCLRMTSATCFWGWGTLAMRGPLQGPSLWGPTALPTAAGGLRPTPQLP